MLPFVFLLLPLPSLTQFGAILLTLLDQILDLPVKNSVRLCSIYSWKLTSSSDSFPSQCPSLPPVQGYSKDTNYLGAYQCLIPIDGFLQFLHPLKCQTFSSPI